ncbi:VOC family protein [Sediminicola luteus]|nr:VOC family protein [Sediminicola luteus]
MKIKALTLYCADLPGQTHFYTTTLGLSLVEQQEDSVVFDIGDSRLRLIRSAGFTPYHFAINIPANKAKEAHRWLAGRLPILKDGPHEIQDFQKWNAQAIYFYDADGNIVECIARRNLRNESQRPFDESALLNISEIGVPVTDIAQTYKSLRSTVDLPIYDGSFERFCAMGDENGLFIGINKHIKDWFPTGDTAYSSTFEIEFEEQGISYSMDFKNGVLKGAGNTSMG